MARMLSARDRKIFAEQAHKVARQALFGSAVRVLMTVKVRVKDWEFLEPEEVA